MIVLLIWLGLPFFSSIYVFVVDHKGGIALGMAMVMYAQEEGADGLIEQLLRDKVSCVCVAIVDL